MAKHRYIANSNDLFEDEVDDETFVNSYRAKIPPPQPKPNANSYGGHIGELERQRQMMLEKQREIEQRTLDSSARSIGLLRDSEQIGIATAEELERQREQLQNTNKRLDEINTNLNYSQKHINGIKSVFYGLKNYISGKSDPPPSRSGASPSTRSAGPSSSRLDDTIDNFSQRTQLDNFESHPSTRLRGLDAQTSAGPITNSQRVNDVLEANLEEMVQHITRLKGLGAELGNQIDHQNELIDTIHDKVEVADIKIGKQNKQMNKILDDGSSEEDEYSTNGFRSRIPAPMRKKGIDNENIPEQEQQNQLTVKKIQEIEKRTLESAIRSFNLLHETGEIAIHTSKELAMQGEQLHNTNVRLDEIDSNLKQSQKDINGIKSIFSGLKKILPGKSRSPSPSNRNILPHKKNPKIGKSKFYGTVDQFSHESTKTNNLEPPSTSLLGQTAGHPSSQQVDNMLEANLEGIAHHITEVKKYAEVIGKEIVHQNELIDKLQVKVEKADIKIGKQNKDMNKILGK